MKNDQRLWAVRNLYQFFSDASGVGNPGNTSEPHLHIQIQNLPDWRSDNLETYPMQFQNVWITRWGTTSEKPQGELMRNHLIHTLDAPDAK